MAMTARRRAFVAEYLGNGFNATRAALAVGYSKRNAANAGCALRRDPDVAAAIKAELDAQTLSGRAVLARLSEQAAGTLDDFLTDGPTPSIDIGRARERGRLHLVKKYRQVTRRTKRGDTVTTAEIELYDAQAALVAIGRARRLFVDRVELNDWRAEARKEGLTDSQIRDIEEHAIEAITQRMREIGTNDTDTTGNA